MTRALIAVVAASIIAALVPPAAAQTIKLATLAPEGSPWHQVIRDLAESWREISSGRVTLRIYAGGVAGDEPDVVRKMRVGQLQAAALTGAGLTKIAPEVQALQMPMLLRSDAELDYVRARIGPKLEANLEAKGFKVLTWGDAGWVRFFTRQPVVSPEDLRPLPVFVWAGDTAVVDAWKDDGYRPIPLAATDIYTALQSGMIKAVPTTPIAALSFQWFALAPHMTELKWAPLVGALVITTRSWRALPDDLKPRLLDAAREAGVRLQERIRPLDDEAIRVMTEHGLTVHAVPPQAVAKWERSARGGYSKIVGRIVPAEIVTEVERLRDEYRALRRGP